MQKISTIIWTCSLLLISVCCFADSTGREPQLMASNGTTTATNAGYPPNPSTLQNTTTTNTDYPANSSTTQNTTTANTLNSPTTQNTTTTNTPNAPTTQNTTTTNTPNPAEILSGATNANTNEIPPSVGVPPGPIVTDTIYNLMYQNRVPGIAVAIYVNGHPYLYNFGVANVVTRQPVTEGTIFEIGSITKTFTTLLLSIELNEGRMHLNDSVMRYASSLQRLTGAVNYITLEQLATHTSSLPYELPDYYISTQEAFCNYLNRWHPSHRIGSTWQYSNIGFGLLGYMLEGATAETYDQLLHQRILNPLGMYHTEIEVPYVLENNYAQGYNWDGSPAKQWRHNDIIPAEGSIKTTSQDMLKYLMASLGVPGTPPDILSGIHTSCYAYVATRFGLQGLAWEKHPLYSLNDYGFINRTRVLFLRDSYASEIPLNDPAVQNDNMLIDKTGTTEGFTSYIALIPAQKIGIVILANRVALREQIGEAGRVILLHLLQNNPTTFYASAPQRIVTTSAVVNTVPPHNYVTSTPVVTSITVHPIVHHNIVVHRHYVVHHHKHYVIHQTVIHKTVVKHKVIIKKRHVKIVKKTVTVTTTN